MTEEDLRPEVDLRKVNLGQEKRKASLTPELMETWQTGVRLLFKKVVERHGDQAWSRVESAMAELHPDLGPDDRDWAVPILTGERDIKEAEAARFLLERFQDRTPLIDGLRAVLNADSQETGKD